MLYKFQLTINYINPPHNSSHTTIKTPNTTVLPPPSCRTHVKGSLYFGHGLTAAVLGYKLCGLLYNEASEDNAASFLTVFHLQTNKCTRHCRLPILMKRQYQCTGQQIHSRQLLTSDTTPISSDTL